jgi:ABC-type transport system substrate-binding protein
LPRPRVEQQRLQRRPKPPLGARRAGAPVQYGGKLRTAGFTDVRSLDAATAFDTASAAIEGLIYDRLLTYDERGEITPELAESFTPSADGRVYTVSLRRGVLFHDGSELEATDVKRSIERSLHVDTPCPVPSYYDRLEGYAAYHAGKAPELAGVRVTGKYSLELRLSQPDSTFPLLMALPIMAPLCKSAGRTYSRGFSGQACGAGPFKLVEFEGGNRIRVVRHEGYWKKGEPKLDEIEWQLNVQPFTQRYKFERGELDYVAELSFADSLAYSNDPTWKPLGAWEVPHVVFGMFMNTELPPFDDVHVRRAVAYAIDREALAKLRPGMITPSYRMVPDSITPDAPDLPRQRHDYARALEEMRLAGLAYDPSTGRGGYPGTIRYLTLIDSFGQASAEVYQQQLARIGLRIRLETVGWPTFLAKTGRAKTVAMGTAGWNADYPDPSTFFEPILSSRAIQEEESQNAAFFRNAELDRVLDEARLATDAGRRRTLYRRAEAIVVDQAPWAITYANRALELTQPYVHGYAPHPVLTRHVRGAFIDRDARPATLARARRARSTLGLAFALAPAPPGPTTRSPAP